MIKSRITLEVLAPTTPKGEKVYLAGSLNAWKVGDPAYAFQEIEPGKFQLVLELTRGTLLEYKLNRGNWNTVEVDDGGQAHRQPQG